MGITKFTLETGDFLLLIRSVVTGTADRYITIVFLVLLFPAGQGAKTDTKVLTALFLGEIGMFADILQGIKLKLFRCIVQHDCLWKYRK